MKNKNESVEKMNLNIQLFADEAANLVDLDTNLGDTNDASVIDADDKIDGEPAIVEQEPVVDKTKEYSKRLNEDREKIRKEIEASQKEKLDKIAKTRNFDNWDELESAMEKERLEQMGIVDENEFKKYLNEIISNTPEIVRAKEIIAKEEAEKKEKLIIDEIGKITSVNSDIKTIDDLVKIERFDEFDAKVKQGYSLSDAYKLTYFDELQNKKYNAAKQEALLNIDSKSHMKTTTGGVTDDIAIPEDIMASYKANTKMSDAEIRKHYKKFIENK